MELCYHKLICICSPCTWCWLGRLLSRVWLVEIINDMLFYWDSEDSMRTRGAVIHEGACCASEVASSIQTSCQFFIAVHFLFFQPEHTDISIFLFSNRDLLFLHESVEYILLSLSRDCARLEQVIEFFIVYFQEGALDDKFCLVLSLVHLVKD